MASVSHVLLTKMDAMELHKRDVFGRTILHLLILCNRYDLLRQLLRNPESKGVIAAVDYENGWNILHYIFYHKRLQCFKVVLAHLNQNLTVLYDLLRIKDRAHQTPLQLLNNDFKDLMWVPQYINEKNEYHLAYRYPGGKPRNHIWWRRGGSDVYMLGSNVNNNLGVGDTSNRGTPTKLLHEHFRPYHRNSIRSILRKPRYRQVHLSKYHSVVLTDDGLYSCGVGSKGRLGHGSDNSNQYSFKQVEFFEGMTVRALAVSNYHTVAISGSTIYSWGLNQYSQLGGVAEDYDGTPREVFVGDLKRRKQPIIGTCVSKIHSMVYTKNSVYLWGLNIGQMGVSSGATTEHRVHDRTFKGDIQSVPKEFTLREDIRLVQTCETCTVVVTHDNDIHVYFQHQHVKLPRLSNRGLARFDVFQPSSLTRAPTIKKVCLKSHESIGLLLDSGDIMGFSLMGDVKNPRYQTWWRAYNDDMAAIDFDVSYDGSTVLCTKNGFAFVKSNTPNSRKGSVTESTLAIPVKNKFRKLDGINKVVRVCCDDNFTSFSFIKDDVDLLPLKLQQNDFALDMEYLSPLVETDLYRKQDQLLDVDHDTNCYVTDFFYPEVDGESDDEHQDRQVDDVLYDQHHSKFNPVLNKKPKRGTTQQKISEESTRRYIDLLKLNIQHAFTENHLNSDKEHDGVIRFADSDLVIGIHLAVMRQRLALCARIFSPKEAGEYFTEDGVEGTFDVDTNTLEFTTRVNFVSVLILLHYIYTGVLLPLWEDYPAGNHCPPDIREIKTDYERLSRTFKITDYTKLGGMLDGADTGSNGGDITIVLKDGQLLAHLSVLIARLAFFETVLSNRWDPTMKENISTDKWLNFDGVPQRQFMVVLRHLYGYADEELFDDYTSEIKALSDTDGFINLVLDLIELADELLLVQLKNLCQLAIKDLITIENVGVLLLHAEYLSCPKIFNNCCWSIYNNLEVLLFGNILSDIDFDILHKVEKQFRIYTGCADTTGMSDDAWFETRSNELVAQFTSDMARFNEHFVSDRKGCSSFEPLVDVKYAVRPERKPRKLSLSSRRPSSSKVGKELLELRKLSITNESAIDDGFVDVSRRRKSKTEPEPREEPKPVKVVGFNPSTRPPAKAVRKVSPPGPTLGASSTWASPAVAQPVLGQKLQQPAATKIKGPIVKLSQKERKKLASSAPSAPASAPIPTPSSTPNNPWLTSPSPRQTPSLADIMLQQSLKVEEAQFRDTPRQSLQEIQQEQEFARWWEEEAKRVQQEMEATKKRKPKKRRRPHT